ncbi:hypothetical protein HG536_0H00460 [Torulaspora globosa]|uniref:VPS9 domain-containing protein n=1 Tax=Torulaspora globosa TaxID=48254 RepID=A0A7G3ZMD5_9SACH|nr:uncharacterized protein HG536_0H00460 [Torulaspora globosa]QLL34671.1 hypothetical protein HG536_0H00460 [Torulaspora globosa]
MSQEQIEKDKDVGNTVDPPSPAAALGETVDDIPQSSVKKPMQTLEEDEEEPFYDFQKFSKQLQDPRAEPIVKYTKSFLRNFQTQRALWSADEQTKLVKDFKIFIYDKFREYEPFKSLDGLSLRNAEEGLEKLIMGKLYHRCFSPCLKSLGGDLDEGHAKDLSNDKRLREKIAEFKFLKPEDLDIPSALSGRLSKFVQLSGEELNKVNRFKAPRDKMICILNSCKVIFGMLRHHRLADKGADSFIPLLIFTILRGDIEALASNVSYIDRFRFDDFIRGEASYYLNSLQAAMNYIMTLEVGSLQCAGDESFKTRYDQNRELLRKERAREVSDKPGPPPTPKATTVHSPAPSEYILSPLDEVTNVVVTKFTELFGNKPELAKPETSAQPHPTSAGDSLDVDVLAKRIQEREQRETLETLQSMFPEMDKEIIEDVCIAKKYRIGATVDVLLSL